MEEGLLLPSSAGGLASFPQAAILLQLLPKAQHQKHLGT